MTTAGPKFNLTILAALAAPFVLAILVLGVEISCCFYFKRRAVLCEGGMIYKRHRDRYICVGEEKHELSIREYDAKVAEKASARHQRGS